MSYTIWSRGRLLGRTDLGFVRCIRKSRMGWFHPTPDGEKLMHVATGVSAAMFAYVHRDRHLVDSIGAPALAQAIDRSAEGADLAAAFQHLEALELELRRDDGSVVPTESLGIQDMVALMERYCEEDDDDPDGYNDDEEEEFLRDELREISARELQLDADLEHDLEIIDEWFAEREGFEDLPWSEADLTESEPPRYQVHVHLKDDKDVP